MGSEGREPIPGGAEGEGLPVISLHADYPRQGVRGYSPHVTGYLARPIDPGPWPAVILLHEWWGLNQHFRDLARRLARSGYLVLVPDLYGGAVTDDWGEAALRKASLDVEAATADVLDALPYLERLPFTAGPVGVMGFCLGGGLALLALSRSGAFRCGVIYYHSLFPDERECARLQAPLLGHYGTADRVTPPSEVERFEEALRRYGARYEIAWYEGAPHAFLKDPGSERARESSWERTLSFLHAHLNG